MKIDQSELLLFHITVTKLELIKSLIWSLELQLMTIQVASRELSAKLNQQFEALNNGGNSSTAPRRVNIS